MSKGTHIIELDDAANDLVNAFAELHGMAREGAASQLIGEGAGYRLLAEAEANRKDFSVAVTKQKHEG